MLHPTNQLGGLPLDSFQLLQIARKSFLNVNLKVNECYSNKQFVPLNWQGKVAFHSAESVDVLVLCPEDAL